MVATVEFMQRVCIGISCWQSSGVLTLQQDSVPQALTKDKKRIQGEEIAVHLAWKSTLYVTNFPEKTDDAAIRELFGKVRCSSLPDRVGSLTIMAVWHDLRGTLAKQEV